MIGFLKPSFLWTLTGIAIPVIIHLLSRKEADVIYVGSLRHLNLSFSRQFKSIRINQLLLLFLRILLIIILALIVSGLWFKNTSHISQTKWVLFEKGTENNKDIKNLCDSLKNKGYEFRYLTKGFPLLEENNSISAPHDYWKLSSELETLPLADVIIFSFVKIEGFKGSRPSPPANQHWISLEQGALNYPAEAFSLGSDSILLRIESTNSQLTSFQNKTISKKSNNTYFKYDQQDSIKVEQPSELVIDVVTDTAFDGDRKIFLAAIKTLQQAFPVKIKVTESEPTHYRIDSKKHFVIWLSNKALTLPDSIPGVLYHQNDLCAQLFLEKNNHWQLTKRLTIDNAVDENLAVSIGEILFQHKTIGDKEDRRSMPASMLWSSIPALTSDLSAPTTVQKTAELYLLLLFVLLLCVERFVAYQKNQ